MLIFRLGWLNIWNPIKAEGCMWLNISRREERQVLHDITVHLLIFLENLNTSLPKHWLNILYLYTTYIQLHTGFPNACGSQAQ